MKTYRRHRCHSKHRTYRTLAKCMIPNAVWVVGEGPYALIAWCSVPSVTLWKTLDAAQEAMKPITPRGCGSNCSGRHEMVRLEMGIVTPDQPTPPSTPIPPNPARETRPCIFCGHPVDEARAASGWASCSDCAAGAWPPAGP